MGVLKFAFHPGITGTHPDTGQLARFSRRFLSRTRLADQ
jgi:hypothetical protein